MGSGSKIEIDYLISKFHKYIVYVLSVSYLAIVLKLSIGIHLNYITSIYQEWFNNVNKGTEAGHIYRYLRERHHKFAC